MEPRLREQVGLSLDQFMMLVSSSTASLEDCQLNVLEYDMRDTHGRQSHRVKVSDKVVFDPLSRTIMVEIFDVRTGELHIEILQDC